MKSKEIQDIINFIKKTDLDDVSIETENYKIRVKKNKTTYTTTEKVKSEEVKPLKKIEVEDKPEEKKEKEKENDTKNIIIKSPMIGTFYRKPSPDKDTFVNVGDSIKAGDVLCVIEAMKLFNEIESELSGKIVKVLVDDSTPVEYDQPLFLVDPS